MACHCFHTRLRMAAFTTGVGQRMGGGGAGGLMNIGKAKTRVAAEDGIKVKFAVRSTCLT